MKNTEETWRALKDSQRVYKNLIKKIKRNFWRQWFSESSTFSDTAKLFKILADALISFPDFKPFAAPNSRNNTA